MVRRVPRNAAGDPGTSPFYTLLYMERSLATPERAHSEQLAGYAYSVQTD